MGRAKKPLIERYVVHMSGYSYRRMPGFFEKRGKSRFFLTTDRFGREDGNSFAARQVFKNKNKAKSQVLKNMEKWLDREHKDDPEVLP